MLRTIFIPTFLLLIFFSFSPTGGFSAQYSGQFFEKDPFANDVMPGDLEGTFEQCIGNFLSGQADLPYKEYHFECYEVIGYLFRLNYIDYEGNVTNLERPMGENGAVTIELVESYHEEYGNRMEEDENGDEVPTEVLVGQYTFIAIGRAKCADPSFRMTAGRNRIEVDEETTLSIDMGCGNWPMWEKEVTLTLEGVGELGETEIELDMFGHGEVVFRGTERGRAEITATTTNCDTWPEEKTEPSATAVIRVGEPGVAIDLTYDASQDMGIFSSTFVLTNHVSVPLDVDEAGNVTGEGTVETDFDFDYQTDQAHTENFRYTGFDSCSVEGTYIDGEYLFTITLTGFLHFEHVVNMGPAGETRIPIESPIMWQQFLAEPIRLTDDKESTFTAAGSIPMTSGTYIIEAYWEKDE